MTITYRQLSRTANEIRFANPEKIMNTVGIRVNTQPKKAGAETVYNAKGQVTAQRTITLAPRPGCEGECAPVNEEKITGTFSFSGSTRSKADVKQVLADLRAWTILFENDLTSGFLPTDVVITSSEVAPLAPKSK